MYEALLITIGSIAALTALAIFRKAPLDTSAFDWLHEQPVHIAMLGMYSVITAVSLLALAFTSIIFEPGITTFTELGVVFFWSGILFTTGYLMITGARYHNETGHLPRAVLYGPHQ